MKNDLEDFTDDLARDYVFMLKRFYFIYFIVIFLLILFYNW